MSSDRPVVEGEAIDDAALTLTDDDMPALFKAADYTSTSGQHQYLLATRLRLSLLVVAAAAGAASVVRQEINWPGFVGATAFAGAALAELYILRERPNRRWFDGRAAAESAKTLGWRYAVAGEPFSLDLSPRDADLLLIERLESILTDLGELSFDPRRTASTQITPAMRELRKAPLRVRKAAYEADRIENQASWYAAKSIWNQRRARTLTRVMLALEVFGLLGGLFHAVDARLLPDDLTLNVLGLMATAAAALGAWMQTKQHQNLSQAYAVAAHELSAIQALIPWQETEPGWSNFVDEAETAISREHTLWRANQGLPRRTV